MGVLDLIYRHVYIPVIKVTLDLQEPLYRQVQEQAGAQGWSISELTAELYREWLAGASDVPGGQGPSAGGVVGKGDG